VTGNPAIFERAMAARLRSQTTPLHRLPSRLARGKARILKAFAAAAGARPGE
jgi:hypothetical protein